MATDKFRLIRTPSDAIQIIPDAISVGEERWTLVEKTSGLRKERGKRTVDFEELRELESRVY